MPAEVFLDTSFAIALSAVSDQHHARAIVLANKLQASQTKLVTTRVVLMEIGNALARQKYRTAAIRLLTALENDPRVEIFPLTDQLYAQALALFQQRPDKEWGLIDRASFEIMRERGISEALTADEHFRQAGFRAALLDPQP